MVLVPAETNLSEGIRKLTLLGLADESPKDIRLQLPASPTVYPAFVARFLARMNHGHVYQKPRQGRIHWCGAIEVPDVVVVRKGEITCLQLQAKELDNRINDCILEQDIGKYRSVCLETH